MVAPACKYKFSPNFWANFVHPQYRVHWVGEVQHIVSHNRRVACRGRRYARGNHAKHQPQRAQGHISNQQAVEAGSRDALMPHRLHDSAQGGYVRIVIALILLTLCVSLEPVCRVEYSVIHLLLGQLCQLRGPGCKGCLQLRQGVRKARCILQNLRQQQTARCRRPARNQ